MDDELRVRLMGGLAVDGVPEREVGSRKARRLLALLASARGETVAVDRAADVLWGEALPAKPADQVGVLVSRLRAVVGADHIVRRPPGYALAGAWLDVEEIERRVEEATTAHGAGKLAAARAAAEAALVLVRGELLPGEDGDWVLAARERVDAAVAAARRVRLEATFDAGDWHAVVAQAETMLVDHPYDEAVLRVLMRAYAASGSTAGALAAYARARHRFAEDLGVTPSTATEQLHTQLLVDADSLTVAGVPAAQRTALPGRAVELGRLDRLLDGVRDGGARVVAVEGEAGIGKTSLVSAWLGSLDPATVLVAEGHCDALGRDLPLGPVSDALAGAARMEPPGGLDRLSALDAWILASVAGVGTPPSPAEGTAVEQAQVFSALLRGLSALAGDRVTVVAIDDVHHADAATLSWLGWAVHRGDRLLLVVARRPGGPAIDREDTVAVAPLDVEAVGEVAGVDRAKELHARSGGHPLLLRAMLGAGAESGPPATIRDAVDRELGALQGGGATLRSAAVFGPEIDVDVLAAVQQVPFAAVLDDLDAAVAAGLLDEAGAGYRFRHELIRAAVEASMTSARRAFVHRQAARVLAARPHVDPLTVAFHARRGGDVELAARSLVDAARLAAARYDLDRADELLTDAIALDGAGSAFVERARLRMSRRDLDGATADGEAAVAAGADAAGFEALGWVAYYRRDYQRAAELAGEALAATSDPVGRAGPLALSARVLHGQGDLPRALERFAEAEGGPVETRQIAAVWHANAMLHAGRPGDALAHVERAFLGPAGSHPFAPVHGRWTQALALAHLGRIDDAFSALAELDALVERAGDLGRRFVGPACNVRGYLFRQVGRHPEADEWNARAREHTSAPDGRPAAGAMEEAYWVAHLDLAEGRLAAGDTTGAAALESEMAPMDTWSGTMAWHQRHRLDLLRARLSALDGDRDRAIGLASGVVVDARSRQARRYEVVAGATLALAGGIDDLGEVDAIIEQLRSCAALEAWRFTAALGEHFGVERWRVTAEQLAADLLARAGDHADALSAEVARLLG